ncbi:hypothetical protein AB4097_20270 [Microvirga sp. 2MCAF35]|uniref:hypothetical protein n=1 Tax=Microvirga sp. 2MCAF35 TaxID=3232987 RepID=UPI003F961C61
MLKLEEGRSGQTLGANGSSLDLQDDLGSLTKDINDLKRRISAQVTLVQELAWEAQATESAKAELHRMQETLRDWCAHQDLLVKLQATQI